MNKPNAIAALFVGILLGTMIIGCQNDGPLSPQSNSVVTQEPDFIKLPRNLSLAKIVGDTAVITPEHGGELQLDFKYKYIASSGSEKELKVKMKLKFRDHSVSDTLVASMRLDDEVLRSNIDILFNPHGSTFLRPAILDMEVRDMDVVGFSPQDSVWLYYYDNGTWVKMVAKRVEFKFDEGKIKCDDGELPHFSRYAFGR